MRQKMLVGTIAAAVLAGTVYAGAADARDGAGSAGPTWTEHAGPARVSGANRLDDVAAVSDTLAWAVGRAGAGHLLLRWNGTTWSTVDVAAPEAGTSELVRVHPVSATSAWAVGFAHGKPWILRYRNGAWTSFPTAGLPTGGLAGIATTSTGVPVVVTRGGWNRRAKVGRWSGSSWQLTTPPVPPSDSPYSVASAIRLVPGTGNAFVVVGSASGSFGAWAVRGRPGGTWQNFSPPASISGQGPGAFVYTSDEANDVYPASAGDITLVGTAVTYSDIAGLAPGQRPVVAHWNGSRWTRQKLSSVYGDSLHGIAVQPGKSRLAVGFNNQTLRGDAFEYTPGAGWKRLASPPEGTALYAVAAIPGTAAYWAVGAKGAVVSPDFGSQYLSEDSTYLLRH